MAKNFLSIEHAVYTSNVDLWEKNERRMHGGDAVRDELVRFESETDTSEQYARRKAAACYLNYPMLMGTTFTGHLFRKAPQPGADLSFGSFLGEVQRSDGQSTPNRAELIYYNADGAGQDGSQWDSFWTTAARNAMATGHRWIFCEAPVSAPANVQQEIEGMRPYLIEYSPLSVPWWRIENGMLVALRLHVTEEVFTDNGIEEKEFKILMVRRGFDKLGQEYTGGGWWKYDNDDVLDSSGTWEKTGGEIPMSALYYKRYSQTVGHGDSKMHVMSSPAITELGQVSIQHMNLDSAGDHDAVVAGSRRLYLLGVDTNQQKEVATQVAEGSLIVGVPPGAEGRAPGIFDSGQVSASAAIEARLNSKVKQAEKLMADEATWAPTSSGRSKEAGFRDVKAPILAEMAANIESCQNTMIRFLEMRFGAAKPNGSVKWPKDYDLAPLVDDIKQVIELAVRAEAKSPTLFSRAVVAAANEKGLLEGMTDEEKKTVGAELAASVQNRVNEDAQADALAGLMNGDGL